MTFWLIVLVNAASLESCLWTVANRLNGRSYSRSGQRQASSDAVLRCPAHLRDSIGEFVGAALFSDAVGDRLQTYRMGDAHRDLRDVRPRRQQRLVRIEQCRRGV